MTTPKYKRTPLSEIIGNYGIAGVHPAAALLPMLSDQEFQSMCEDVDAQGFLHPVRIDDDNMLIDGRNRIQVGWALGKDPSIERFNPIDVFAYVISENIARRHLTPGQLAMIAAKLANLRNGERADRVAFVSAKATTEQQAAEQVGSTANAVSKARTIKVWAPAEAANIEAGKTTLEQGYKVARNRKKAVERIEEPAKPKPQAKTVLLTGIIDKKLVEVRYPQPQGKHQFNRTNDAIDWASWTWNPVTGCLHGCKYCYAREMAYRDSYKASYPIQFAPLFHHERLADPVNTKPGTDRPEDGRVFVL